MVMIETRIKNLIRYLGMLMLALAMVISIMPSTVFASDIPATIVDLVLLPASQNADSGSALTVTVQAQCNGQAVVGVSAFLDFDPNLLEVQSVTSGGILNTPLQNTFDNSLGTVDYSAGKMTEPFPNYTFTVATIIFKAKGVTASTPVNFHLSNSRITKAVYGSTPVLRQTIGATIGVQAKSISTPIPSPTVTTTPRTPTPSPTVVPSTTPTPSSPVAIAQNVIYITPEKVTLKGALTSLGNSPQVQVSFEWGYDTGYGNVTPIQTLTSPGEFSYELAGLKAMTEYHYRVKAVGSTTVYSADFQFITPAFVANNPTPPSPPSVSSPVAAAGTPVFTTPATSTAPAGTSSPEPSNGSWVIWLAAAVVVVVAAVISLVVLKKRPGSRK